MKLFFKATNNFIKEKLEMSTLYLMISLKHSDLQEMIYYCMAIIDSLDMKETRKSFFAIKNTYKIVLGLLFISLEKLFIHYFLLNSFLHLA